MAKTMRHSFSLNNRRFVVDIDKELNIATGKFSRYRAPVISWELNDYIVLHYEEITGDLVGFTILHLKEFGAYVENTLLKKLASPYKANEEKKWLRDKAQQSIYETVNKREWRHFWNIPEPFWHNKGRAAF